MEEKTQQYELYILEWQEIEGFSYLFDRMCGEYPHSPATIAYEAAERNYISKFGKRKYSSYASFKQVRNRYLRERNKGLLIK